MRRFVKSVLLVCCFVFSKSNFAQDIRGGWIEYKWISGYTYSFTTTLLVDSVLDANRTGISMFGCGPTSTLSGISNSGKIKIYKFSEINTLSGPGNCVGYIEESSRVQYIRNMPQSHQQALYVYSILNINSFGGPNSTPILTSLPVNLTTSLNTITYNPGAIDPDGDSLSYQLVHCLRSPSMSYQHIFFPNTAINNYGTLTIPNDSTGLFAFCIKISEWRKDVNGNYQPINETPIDFVVDMVSSVGINELNKNEMISIYPNPTSNILNIKSNSKTNSEIEITNQLGQTVLKQKFSESIDVCKLVPGCYFIRVDNSYSKFIKE